jgi:hypothetical protein
LDYSIDDWAALPIQVFNAVEARELDHVRPFRLMPASGEWLAVVDLPKTQTPTLWGTQMQFIVRTRETGVQISKVWEDYRDK